MTAAAGRGKRRSRSSLAVVEQAYRGSLEEQYGHIVWLSRVMRQMGADHALLLKADTVLFARRDQPALALTLGGLTIGGLSHHESGVAALVAANVPVYAWRPDLHRLRLSPADLIDGVESVDEADMPTLIHRFNNVWYW